MKIIDKHRCINNDPEHQNNLSDNLYYEPVSKDPRGPEGPEASPEVVDNSITKDNDIFKIGEHVVQIIIK